VALVAALSVWALFLTNATDAGCGRSAVDGLSLTPGGDVALMFEGRPWVIAADGTVSEAREFSTVPYEQQRCAADGSCFTIDAGVVYGDGVPVLTHSAHEREAVQATTACASAALAYRDVLVRPVAGGEELWVAAGTQGAVVRRVDGSWERIGVLGATPLPQDRTDLAFAPLVPLALAALAPGVVLLVLRRRAVTVETRTALVRTAVVANLVVVGIALVFGPGQNVWSLCERDAIWQVWTLVATAGAQIAWIAPTVAVARGGRKELSRNPPGS
jgi:hypothetical protein